MTYEVFTDQVMSNIRDILNRHKSEEDPDFERLRDMLEESGKHFREIIRTTPCDLPGQPIDCSLSERASWLSSNVISPSLKLADAAHEKQRAMFSTWPDDAVEASPPDWDLLAIELEKVRAFAQALQDDLVYQASEDAGHNQEIRYMIVEHITHALKVTVPSLKPSRGTYDKGHGWVGDYPAVIRAAYEAITGEPEKLGRIIENFVKPIKN